MPPAPTASAIHTWTAMWSAGNENPVLIGRYTGMEAIKCEMALDIFWPTGNNVQRILIQTTGNRYAARERISARKGLWHRAEIPATMPVSRTALTILRNVIYRKKPRTLSGQ